MARSQVSVFINTFSNSAAQNDVLDFLNPFKPIQIRLRPRNNDPRGGQFAIVDFADEATALVLIAEKNFSRFMGQSMKLKLAFANQNTFNNNNSSNNAGNRSFQENRSSLQARNTPQRLHSPKGRSRLREIQIPREIVRGNFKIIKSVSCTHFVALESGWESDMDGLSEGLEDFANYAKCGVDDMDPGVVHACKDPVSGKWRRCRKIGEESGMLVVELIDLGGSLMVTKDQVLSLSQLYKDWSIKAVDVFLEGYAATSSSKETFEKIEEHLLNKTFQLAYLHERTGALLRDCARVQDMRLDGESVLDELVQKGLLFKRQLPQEGTPTPTTGSERAITKSSTTPLLPRTSQPSTPHTERPCPRVQHRIDGVKPMEVEIKVVGGTSRNSETQWGEWSQQGQGTNTQSRQNNSQSTDGWGSVGLARDDIGTEVWDRVDDRVPSGALTDTWAESGHETSPSNRTAPAWNVQDWSASPPKKASAPTTQGKPSPAASATARAASSPTIGSIVGNQSPANSAANVLKPKKCEDVFSDVDEWSKVSGGTSSNQEPSTPALERLAISEESRCSNCTQLSPKTLEKLVYGRSVQQMISDRIAIISAELNKLKMHITRVSIMASQTEDSMTELKHHRRAAQICTQDLEEIIQLASAQTLAAYHLTAWAQFVGRIWSPMMNLLYINEQPLSVYKSTVIRRAEIEVTDGSIEDDPQLTVVLERAIDPSKIFKFAQDLITHKKAANVHRVFFSEDNSKAFVILDSIALGDFGSLEQFGTWAVDFLLELNIIQ
ncbi:uncharacterized protein LOC100902560 [Galendromus occidentalis]|uniref:Uncharacterized protein LOC100902560 n=1 Tax=Galendromus occidentalis TaxID=34638 RepID=A0AAJ7WI67_9ACAR|nr:uncharacterized protein LOC100902560 [Galendromus occidentalis]